jgi:Protein of unknown function (DUF3500)
MGHNHKHLAPSRRDFLGSTAAAGACLPLSALAFAALPELAQAMGQAAQAWWGLLGPQAQARARLAWTDPHRNAWHYVPRSRPGVALREMTSAQAAAAWDLCATLLSARGLEQVRGQLLLERTLGELTQQISFRDPGNYALVLFGDPAGPAPWCWRFEGHHLSLTTVVAPGHGVAVTPVFFGANPAKVPARHAHAGFRLLGAEEDQAFALIRSLDAEARAKAVIADRSLGDIVAGPGRELSLARFEGIALSALSDGQRDGVLRILELYAGTLREEIARPALARLREAGLETLHFAWAGSPERGRPHYFRVHGPTVLVEYDNTQNGANHVHSLWIDPQSAFGRDLLRAHYQGAH